MQLCCYLQLECGDSGESCDGDPSSDPRPWTQEHLEAANIPSPGIMALTPPQGEVGIPHVDSRGPGGFTPLMLASYCGSGMNTTSEDDSDSDLAVAGSAGIITHLLGQGAQINAQTDLTGETSLHLAARYARADAAKRLLDAGADKKQARNTHTCPVDGCSKRVVWLSQHLRKAHGITVSSNILCTFIPNGAIFVSIRFISNLLHVNVIYKD